LDFLSPPLHRGEVLMSAARLNRMSGCRLTLRGWAYVEAHAERLLEARFWDRTVLDAALEVAFVGGAGNVAEIVMSPTGEMREEEIPF
jgi:hypothetical protein